MSFSSKPPKLAPRNSYEPDDRGVSPAVGSRCRSCHNNAGVTSSPSGRVGTDAITRRQDRGLLWLVGAFVICPCHLPLTLGLVATLFAGTALGVLVSSHPYVIGALLTVVWLIATLYAFRLLREHPD